MAAILLVTVALAGCFDGGEDGDTTTTTTTTTDGMTGTLTQTQTTTTATNTTDTQTTTGTTTEEPKRDPVTWDIEVQDNEFAPQTLSVQVNDTVRWTQSGGNPHSVTADDGSFDSHPDCDQVTGFLLSTCMGDGDTFEFTFETVGDGAYFCKVHGGEGGSGMSGVVSVLERHDATPDAG
jgi:plastocyanin